MATTKRVGAERRRSQKLIMKILLATVPHTGTTSLEAQIKEVYRSECKVTHLVKNVIEELPGYDIVITTVRDPYRVGAAWVNRYGRFYKKPKENKAWFTNWDNLAKLLQCPETRVYYSSNENRADSKRLRMPPDRPHEDTHRAYAALDNNMDYFYSMIPRSHIIHAREALLNGNY